MKQCTCYALRAVDCTCKPAKYGELYTSPTAKQEQGEPVAMQMDVIVGNLVREGINKHRARELAEHFIKHTTPQPAQKPWVGLTKEERDSIWSADQMSQEEWNEFFDTIEAKLKEKNT